MDNYKIGGGKQLFLFISIKYLLGQIYKFRPTKMRTNKKNDAMF